MNARSVIIGIGTVVVTTISSAAITFPDALDATNLVWVTAVDSGTERAWVATNTAPHDGIDDATCGNHFVPESDSWIETQVVGPGRISFWWRVSCEDPQIVFDELTYFDYLEFKISEASAPDWFNTPPLALIAGNLNWEYRTFAVPGGTNILRWNYHKDDNVNSFLDLAFLDEVAYEFTPVSIPESINLCGIPWLTGGDAAWVGQTNVTVDGKAAESGAINPGQESYFQVVVSGVSNVSFLWKVSSPTNADYLEFYTNSYIHDPQSPPANFAARISGTVNSWQSNYFNLSATETNTLTWRYVKNSSASVPGDRGWLDQVSFNPKVSPGAFSLAAPTRLPDGQFQLKLGGLTNCQCQVEYSTNLVTWSKLADQFLTGNSVTVLDPGATNSESRFYRGTVQ